LTALRLSYGVSERLPRIIADEPVLYEPVMPVNLGAHEYTRHTHSAGWNIKRMIPPGTIISMSNSIQSHDENVFPDSYAYKPERWLNDTQEKRDQPLTKYIVAFGQGQRSCVGKPLAIPLLVIAVATLFCRFTPELYNTSVADVTNARTCFVPLPQRGSKGVCVKVAAQKKTE